MWRRNCRFSVIAVVAFLLCFSTTVCLPEELASPQLTVEDVDDLVTRAFQEDSISDKHKRRLLSFGPSIIGALEKNARSESDKQFARDVSKHFKAVQSGAREDAIDAIRFFYDWNAEEFLFPALTRKDYEIRGRAGSVLSEIGTIKSFPHLLAGYRANAEYGFGIPNPTPRYAGGEAEAGLEMEKIRLVGILKRLLKQQGVAVPEDSREGEPFIKFGEKWWADREVKSRGKRDGAATKTGVSRALLSEQRKPAPGRAAERTQPEPELLIEGAARAKDVLEFIASWTSKDLVRRAYQVYRARFDEEHMGEKPRPNFPLKLDFHYADSDVIDRDVWAGRLMAASLSEAQADWDRQGRPAPDPGQRRRIQQYPLGQYVVGIVVNAKQPVTSLTLAQVRDIFTGEIKRWNQVSGGRGASAIELFGQLTVSTPGVILQLTAMEGRPYDADLRNLRAKPLRQGLSPGEALGKVVENANGIAFLQLTPGEPLSPLVRVLRIAPDEKTPAVEPTLENVATGKYPLADQQTIYLRNDAPRELRDFCEFATGRTCGAALSRQGLFAHYQLQECLGKERLAEFKAGKGTPVVVCGLAGREDVVKALAVEYVKAKALVQVKYEARATTEEAEGAFGEKGELMVEEGVVRGQLSVVNGQLSVAGGAKQRTTDHGQRTTYPLGHRAVGVIVHRDSAVKELTLDDLRGIYSGQIDTWPGASGKDAKMRLYGLAAETATMKVLAEVVRGPLSVVRGKTEGGGQKAEGGRHARITRRDDTAKVVQAVANEPGAIGFVDLAAMPANESSVKLLAILADGVGPGSQAPASEPARGETARSEAGASERGRKAGASERGRWPAPTPDSVPEGYPLAQPVVLCVHARASDVAKDFAAFVAAHGPEVQESLRASGIVPAPPPKAESGGQRAEGIGQKAEGGGQKAGGLGAVVLGQWEEEEGSGQSAEGGARKAEKAALTPGPSPASGRGEIASRFTPDAARSTPDAVPPEDSAGGADVRVVAGAALLAGAVALGLFALRLARR